MARARILIVDDLAAVRKQIRSLLLQNSFFVCGEAASGPEAVRKTSELKPDVVLLDIGMRGMNGVQTALEIRRKSPETKIVFLTVHNIPAVEHNTRTWADGFVTKSAASLQLVPLLRRMTAKAAVSQFHNDLYDRPEGKLLL